MTPRILDSVASRRGEENYLKRYPKNYGEGNTCGRRRSIHIDLTVECEPYQLGGRRHPEDLHHLVLVAFNRPRRQTEIRSDLLHPLDSHDQPQDVALSWRQPRFLHLRRPDHVFHDILRDGWRDVDLPVDHVPDGGDEFVTSRLL